MSEDRKTQKSKKRIKKVKTRLQVLILPFYPSIKLTLNPLIYGDILLPLNPKPVFDEYFYSKRIAAISKNANSFYSIKMHTVQPPQTVLTPYIDQLGTSSDPLKKLLANKLRVYQIQMDYLLTNKKISEKDLPLSLDHQIVEYEQFLDKLAAEALKPYGPHANVILIKTRYNPLNQTLQDYEILLNENILTTLDFDFSTLNKVTNQEIPNIKDDSNSLSYTNNIIEGLISQNDQELRCFCNLINIKTKILIPCEIIMKFIRGEVFYGYYNMVQLLIFQKQ